MKFNKILACLAFAAAVGTARAGVFYWQFSVGGDSAFAQQYKIALEQAGSEALYLYLFANGARSTGTELAAGDDGSLTSGDSPLDYVLGADAASASFYWELVGGTGDAATTYLKSETKSYGDLLDYISSNPTAGQFGVFNAGTLSYTLVPEPTSGLLLLLGVAGLALRRRRVFASIAHEGAQPQRRGL